MMIVFYDEKHQQIIEQKEIPRLTQEEQLVTEAALDYVNEKIDSRYKKFELCESVEIVYDEDGFSEIKFYY